MYRPQLTVLNSFSTDYITNLHSVFQPLQSLFQPDIPSSWNAPSASLSHHGLSPKPVSTQSLYHGTELLDERDNSHDCSSPFLCVSVGAGPEVRLALASMAMERPHTFYHCRRTLHTHHRDFEGRGPHPGIPDPKKNRVLAMAIALQVAGPPTMDLCTRVTVVLILDCRPQRLPSTSCL